MWAGLVSAKIRLILVNDISSKKIQGRWERLVLAKLRLIVANDIPFIKKIKGLVLVKIRLILVNN